MNAASYKEENKRYKLAVTNLNIEDAIETQFLICEN